MYFGQKQLLAMAVAGIVAGTSAGAIAQDKRVLRMGFETSLDSAQGVGAQAMARTVAELSDNRIEIQIFPDSQLGTAAKMLDMVKKGELDLFQGGPGIFSSAEKRLNVFDIPYLFKTPAQAWQVLDGPFGLEMLRSFEAQGLKGLSFWETGMRDITNNVRPIIKVGDLRGMKMRIPVNNPAQVAFWKQLGTEPLPLPFGQIHEALKSSKVDAQEHPISLIYSGKFYEVQRYLTLSNHLYTPMIQVMALPTFNGFSEKDRDILVQASRAGATAQRNFARENDAEFLVKMKAQGVKVNEMSAQAREEFRASIRAAMEALYVAENGDAWLRALQAAADGK